MDETSTPLTKEDFEAARQALLQHPEFLERLTPADCKRALAEMHHHWGSDRFTLTMGLREPTKEGDRELLGQFLGGVTTEEAFERLRAYANRPVDEPMLKSFFSELHQQVHRYGCFMQEVGDLFLNPIRQPVSDADESNVTRLAIDIQRKYGLYKQEIVTVFDFLQEIRAANKFGNASLGEFTTPTAAEMVMLVTRRAEQSWKNNQELGNKSRHQPEYIEAIRGVFLFGQSSYPDLPRAQDLLTLLDEEHALARSVLKSRQAAQAAVEPAVAELGASSNVLCEVDSWADLAIGIDERGQYWALTPAPAHGDVFPKSRAVELSLPGDRWKTVLSILSESATGDEAKRADLLSGLGYFAPKSSDVRDTRARPGAIESANIEGMQVRQKAALNRLTTTLSDLRRELSQFVNGPRDRATNCLRTEQAVVRSGFVVRFLIRDESDRLRFGEKR